jgi:hypothetical protein
MQHSLSLKSSKKFIGGACLFAVRLLALLSVIPICASYPSARAREQGCSRKGRRTFPEAEAFPRGFLVHLPCRLLWSRPQSGLPQPLMGQRRTCRRWQRPNTLTESWKRKRKSPCRSIKHQLACHVVRARVKATRKEGIKE